MEKFTIGTRNSPLALAQVEIVKSILEETHWEAKYEILSMTTIGDNILDRSLKDVSMTALFTRELEKALKNNQCDFVVHSLKDLPTSLPENCSIVAVLPRHDREDCLILNKRHRDACSTMDFLTGRGEFADRKLVIGTSSQRRIAMLNSHNKNVTCTNIRGNINTRFNKLDDPNGEYDAIILAKAGLDRMNWSERSSHVLNPDNGFLDWFYAVGQGAIAIECRSNDERVKEHLKPLTDAKTLYEVVAERALMKKLEAGCSAPLGVRTTWSQDSHEHDVIEIRASAMSIDGKTSIKASGSATLDIPQTSNTEIGLGTTQIEPAASFLKLDNVEANMIACADLGISVADKMISQGCTDLMDLARK